MSSSVGAAASSSVSSAASTASTGGATKGSASKGTGTPSTASSSSSSPSAGGGTGSAAPDTGLQRAESGTRSGGGASSKTDDARAFADTVSALARETGATHGSTTTEEPKSDTRTSGPTPSPSPMVSSGRPVMAPVAPRSPDNTPERRPPETSEERRETPQPIVVSDEPLPREKAVRRLETSPMRAAERAEALGRPIHVDADPEVHGISPKKPDSNVRVAGHVMGRTDSKFISASTLRNGAQRIEGTPHYIDMQTVRNAGNPVHTNDEIISALATEASKAKDPARQARIEQIQTLARADAEVLIEGDIPAKAVKGPSAMTLTRVARGAQVVGLAVTAYDVTRAARESIQAESPRPIAAEVLRQAGGWGAAYAGMKAGLVVGAAAGAPTGVGAVVSGVVGGLIGGVAGYFGMDYVADRIHRN
ncbi:MAG: hypothetical protein AAF638_03905 [Pseudomonadota bacterium]